MTLLTNSKGRVLFDPDTPEFRADPYPTYHRLRAEAPVSWSQKHNFWFLSRHADVVAAFNHPSLGHGEQRVVPGESSAVPDSHLPLAEASAHWLLFKDPPDHTRMRRLMQQAFSSLSYQTLPEQIGAFVDALIDPIIERGKTEFISDVAFPLPLLTMTTILGVPEEDRPMMFDWAKQVWGVFDLTPTDEALRRGSSWISALQPYFRRLAGERRAAPRRDLLSAMLAARDGEVCLNEEEILANCALMLFAGHDTTAHLLGNGMLALLSDPGQLERLRGDPNIDDAAVSELLRYTGPQQLAFRNALEDVCLAGVDIKRGDKVCLGIGAANHDPEVFSEPERLIFDRPRLNHVAFASGIHGCIGSRVARLTARIAFRRIVSRWREIRLREHAWEHSVLIRGLRVLHLNVA